MRVLFVEKPNSVYAGQNPTSPVTRAIVAITNNTTLTVPGQVIQATYPDAIVKRRRITRSDALSFVNVITSLLRNIKNGAIAIPRMLEKEAVSKRQRGRTARNDRGKTNEPVVKNPLRAQCEFEVGIRLLVKDGSPAFNQALESRWTSCQFS